MGMLPRGTSTALPRPIRRPRKILYLLVIFFLLYWFGVRHGLGIERKEPLPLGFALPGGRHRRRSSLSWGATGMATLTPTVPGTNPEHPIYELMENAETRWDRLLATQSKTLEQAVATYIRRYRMDPPKGFDAWFRFCQENDVHIVDEYDQMMKDLLPHHALAPDTFLHRSEALEGTAFTYTLDVTRDEVRTSGDRSENARPRLLRGLIDGMRQALPEDFHLKVTGSDHDTGSSVLGRDQRQRAMELVVEGDREDSRCIAFPNLIRRLCRA